MPAGIGKTFDEPIFNRIAGPYDDDRQSRMILGGNRCREALGDNKRDLARDQLVDELRQTVEIAMRCAPFKIEVLPKNEPVPGKTADETGTKRALIGRIGTRREQPNAMNLRLRLIACLRSADHKQ